MKTRFAPSPTGLIHMGNARTALFSALLAAHHSGLFLLRVEDTDTARSKPIYIEALLEDLQWLGIDWQEGIEVGGAHAPYAQSERLSQYTPFYQQLLNDGFAFTCYKTDAELDMMRKTQRAAGCAPRYPKSWRQQSEQEINEKIKLGVKPTLRFKVPDNMVIEFEDGLKGKQCFSADDIGDFVIRKADGTPSFLFCNAVDDALMGVTHVIRGEDHLTNTPRQLAILDALALRKPSYIHIAIILGADDKPLSKRNGSQSIQVLHETGYLPSAVVNYMARLGHYYAANQLMDFAALAAQFSLDSLVKSAAKYDERQLQFWQKTALKSLDSAMLWGWMGTAVHQQVPEAKQALFIQTIRDNILLPDDARQWAIRLFTDERLSLSDEAQIVITQAGAEFFELASATLQESGADFEAISHALKSQLGVKGQQLFQPLRLALTGQLHGPKMADLMELLGVERCRQRLHHAQHLISNQQQK